MAYKLLNVPHMDQWPGAAPTIRVVHCSCPACPLLGTPCTGKLVCTTLLLAPLSSPHNTPPLPASHSLALPSCTCPPQGCPSRSHRLSAGTPPSPESGGASWRGHGTLTCSAWTVVPWRVLLKEEAELAQGRRWQRTEHLGLACWTHPEPRNSSPVPLVHDAPVDYMYQLLLGTG